MRLSPITGALMPVAGFSKVPGPYGTTYRSADGLLVLSSIDDMYLPGTNDTETGPTWLVSVSKNGGRCTDDDLLGADVR